MALFRVSGASLNLRVHGSIPSRLTIRLAPIARPGARSWQASEGEANALSETAGSSRRAASVIHKIPSRDGWLRQQVHAKAVRHADFLGANDPYGALKTTLKAKVDPETWETLHRDTSRPVEESKSGRIAVKGIDSLGDEVMKLFRV